MIKMFFWRVSINALPIKENLSSHLEVEDPCCVLCNQEVVSFAHLFFHCPVARALWFSICWGFKVDEAQQTTAVGIINLILNPPEPLRQVHDKWLVSLYFAYTMEEIRCTKNVVCNHKGKADLQSSIHRVHSKSRNAVSFSPNQFLTQPQCFILKPGLNHHWAQSRSTLMQLSSIQKLPQLSWLEIIEELL